MSKFTIQIVYVEKQFLIDSSADTYAELNDDRKDYEDIEYFLFEQTWLIIYTDDKCRIEDSIPF